MPIFPHINLVGAPEWVRYAVAGCALVYGVIMIWGGINLWRRK